MQVPCIISNKVWCRKWNSVLGCFLTQCHSTPLLLLAPNRDISESDCSDTMWCHHIIVMMSSHSPQTSKMSSLCMVSFALGSATPAMLMLCRTFYFWSNITMEISVDKFISSLNRKPSLFQRDEIASICKSSVFWTFLLHKSSCSNQNSSLTYIWREMPDFITRILLFYMLSSLERNFA